MTEEEIENLMKDLTNPDMISARTEATNDLEVAILGTIHTELKRHGLDPAAPAIIAAAMARVIRDLSKVNPVIELTIALLLSQ